MKTQENSGGSAGDTSFTQRIKELRDDPEGRFQFACGHLPRKQAFREVAIALRALIRQHSDIRREVDVYLGMLYRFAALQALMYSRATDRSADDTEPEPSLLARWEKVAEVSVPYDQVGCDALTLLTKTDRKMMDEAWGPPNSTTTPRAWFDAQSLDSGKASVAAFLRGAATTEGVSGDFVPRRRSTDTNPFAEPEPEPESPEDLAEALAADEQLAEDAVFQLMEDTRADKHDGASKPAKGWAASLRGVLGI